MRVPVRDRRGSRLERGIRDAWAREPGGPSRAPAGPARKGGIVVLRRDFGDTATLYYPWGHPDD
ncbi:MAG TPA: hypothetical protein VIF15_00395 [Polyangiaceae bacterium]